MSEQRKPRTGNILAYGLGDVFGGGSFVLISLLYLFFLTEEVGLSPLAGSAVLGSGKVWDAVSDPLMGYLSDRTRSRFGKRRVYFLAGIFPIALTFYLLWIPVRAASPALTAAYYALAYLLFNTAFTMVMVPYSALGAELSPDFAVRNRLTGARMLFSILSAAIAGIAPDMLLKSAPTLAEGYGRVALAFGLLYALPWLVVYAFTWEAPSPAPPPDRPFSLLGALREALSLLHNRSFRIHIAMYICAYTAMDTMMILFRYYLKWNMGTDSMAQAMGPLMAAEILTIPIYLAIANRKGQALALRVGLVLFATGLGLSYTLHAQSSRLALSGVCALIGAGLSAAVMMPWAILPSVVDVDEAMTGEARSGLHAGAMTLVRKMVQGLIATPVIGLALTLIGYSGSAGGAQGAPSAETIARLKVLFFALPAVFVALAFVASLRFLITPETHAILRAELARLRAGGARADAPAETRALIETLGGARYEEPRAAGGLS